MLQPSCIIKVPSSIDGGTFFHWWIRFLSPFHDLTGREMDVAAALFHHRYELSKRVSDPVLLDSLALNTESRKLVEGRLGISRSYMNVILNKLRNCNILIDNRLNPRFIPDVTHGKEGKMFTVLLVFDFAEDAKRKQEKEQ